MSYQESGSHTEIPYIPFPDNARQVRVGLFSVLEYVKPEVMAGHIAELSSRVNMHAYDGVVVNMNGGMFLYKHLAKLQRYTLRPTLVEYHRPNGGFGARIVKPVPAELKGRRLMVLDDIFDSGGTMQAIMANLDPESQAVALVTKTGISGQLNVGRIEIGIKTDDRWLGGCGMDIGFLLEGNIIRNHAGLVVKIQ